MKKQALLSLYAISPLHAGAGQATGAVDLPIQRERHTGWPLVQASGVKGALRDAVYSSLKNKNTDEKDVDRILNPLFGQEGTRENEATAGSLMLSDARLLAYPMRSDIAPFVWITCPAVLGRFADDLLLLGWTQAEVKILHEVKADNGKVHPLNSEFNQGKILLEEWPLDIGPKKELMVLTDLFPVLNRLFLVPDAVFDYGVTQCTEVQAQIKIDTKTGTAQDGSLRYQELLPADSQLYGVCLLQGARAEELQAETLYSYLKDNLGTHLQLGGDWTLGRGLCKVDWKIKE